MKPGTYVLKNHSYQQEDYRMDVYPAPTAEAKAALTTLYEGDVVVVLSDTERFFSERPYHWWWVPVMANGCIGWMVGLWSPDRIPHLKAVEEHGQT